MIQYNTGTGKGKTTAAIGQAIRGAGSGMQVIFAQFMKGSTRNEFNILSKLDNMRIYRNEKDFGLYETMSKEEKAELADIHNRILDDLLEAVQDKSCQMIVLDDITYPTKWQLLDESKLRQLLEFGDRVELILTGRETVEYFVAQADYITNMGPVSHPHDKGVPPRKGIEY